MKLRAVLGALFVVACVANAADAPIPATIEFNRDVRPILSDKCYACHGPGRQSGTIRFDREEGAKHDLSGGRHAIVAGNVANSVMIQRITSSDPARRMPMNGEALSARDTEVLKRWIEQGATWQAHWSFIPPKRPTTPEVQNKAWVKNPIDAFVLQRLEKEGVKPSPEANRAALLRRVSLDLSGLPPTPAEVDAFIADKSPNAYEKIVDRLLASPRYGERMAQPWLDASRYADTNGYQSDGDRVMWRWRDWVIDAFNKNKKFDQFVVEQLAGDLLPNATLDQKIATAFNRNGMSSTEGGADPEEYMNKYVTDRVNTFGTVFLGSSIQCAECHDHKYDPFTQREYYQLYDFFNRIPEKGLDNDPAPPFMPPSTSMVWPVV